MLRLPLISFLATAVALLTLGSASQGPLSRADAEPPRDIAPKGGRHALLIGCTAYPNLDKKFWLNGPSNDVQLMAKALREMFGFAPENITILCDEVAKAKKDNKLEPTKANIKREFERLAKVAREGDKVVILMGGHGSQMPQGVNPPNPKPDGLSEIFLPRDVGKWDDTAGEVTNAIVDHELADWLKAIQNTRATIWITVDSCHSGTITRDVFNVEKTREVDNKNTLGVPQAAINKAQQQAKIRQAGARGLPGQPNPGPGPGQKEGGLVAIYASLASEPTLEREMPKGSRDAKPYGLLTYTLVETLQQANQHSDKPLTYRELVQGIQSRYTKGDRQSPTPLIEGVDADREVLGEKHWASRSSITLADDGNGLKVTAGSLAGLTNGSILAVYPPPGLGNKVQGHVCVTEVRTLDADVKPCAFENMALVQKPPLEGVCKVVFVDYGDQQVKLAVDPRGMQGEVMDEKVRARLVKTLGKLNEPRVVEKDDPNTLGLVRFVANPAEADWLLMPHRNGQLVLVASADRIGGAKDDPPRLFGPYQEDGKLIGELEKSLLKIIRYENLKKMAAGFTDDSGDQGVKLKVEMRRAADSEDKDGKFPIPWPSTNLTFYDGDLVIFNVTNTGRVPVDFTLLYLDSEYQIACTYPGKTKNINRLEPGKTKKFPPVPVLTKTVGIEYMVVIGVRGDGQNKDFAFLEQDSVPRARGNPPAFLSLLQKAAYNQGNARGMKTAEVDDHFMELLTWRIKPEQRPKEKK
jgi:uncharacterized caspase-like protein